MGVQRSDFLWFWQTLCGEWVLGGLLPRGRLVEDVFLFLFVESLLSTTVVVAEFCCIFYGVMIALSANKSSEGGTFD